MRRISGVSLKHEKTLLSPEVRKTPFKVALGRELPAPAPPRSVLCPAAAGPILMEMRSPAVPRGGGRDRGPGGLSLRPAWLPGATSPPLRAPRPPGPGADKEEEGAALPPVPPLLAVVGGRIPAARGAPRTPARSPPRVPPGGHVGARLPDTPPGAAHPGGSVAPYWSCHRCSCWHCLRPKLCTPVSLRNYLQGNKSSWASSSLPTAASVGKTWAFRSWSARL